MAELIEGFPIHIVLYVHRRIECNREVIRVESQRGVKRTIEKDSKTSIRHCVIPIGALTLRLAVKTLDCLLNSGGKF